MAAKFGPSEKSISATSKLPQPLCPHHVSHQHCPHHPPPHHYRKPLPPFGYHGPRQLLPQPNPPLGWPRRAHAHEPGAATTTHRLGSAPTADWVPRDELRPHAQESPETQPPSHRLRGVERPRPRQATVAAADPLHAPAQPSDAQPSDAQPSDAQPSGAQPASSARPREPCPPALRAPALARDPRPRAIRRNARRPVRCPRQPRQRPTTSSTSAAPSCASHRARQLKKKDSENFSNYLWSFRTRMPFAARIYCDEQYFYWAARFAFGNKRGN
jgi:hypothetical protein